MPLDDTDSDEEAEGLVSVVSIEAGLGGEEAAGGRKGEPLIDRAGGQSTDATGGMFEALVPIRVRFRVRVRATRGGRPATIHETPLTIPSLRLSVAVLDPESRHRSQPQP